jgi:hypothetical protein
MFFFHPYVQAYSTPIYLCEIFYANNNNNNNNVIILVLSMPSSLTKGLWFHSRCVSLKEESRQALLPFKGQIRACDVHINICTISSKQKL